MLVYAIALEKGGVGKTALAVNLAAAFVQLGQRVLLVDLDAQGHATHWLGVDPPSVQPDDSVLGLLHGRALQANARRTAEGVDLVPAHPIVASFPILLSSTPNSGVFVLQDALAQLAPAGAYDIVIADLAPARGPVLASALAAATRCLAPVQPEDLVLRALQALAESVSQAQRVNPRLRGLRIVRNRYSVRSTGDQVYDAQLRAAYGLQLLHTILPVRAALRDATGLQQSVFRFSGPDAAEVRGRLLNLANELLDLEEGA